jgi:hypothetical protein
LPSSSAPRHENLFHVIKNAPIQGSRTGRIGPRKKEKSMSSSTTSPPRRPRAARLKRVVAAAVAVTVGAIVLSGCVVIQSESALQAGVIGGSVTVTTTLCASQPAAAAPCNSPGNSNKYAVSNPTGTPASAPGQLLVGYRIPAGVSAPATIATSVPSVDENGAPITVPLTLTQNPAYAAGLSAIAPPPAGTVWVGYASEFKEYRQNGPQVVTFAPTFTLPPGFTGTFTWRTVVGYRSNYFQSQPVTCPGAFPGTSSPVPGQVSQCVDYPDAGTVNAAPNAYETGNLSIVAPATPTVAAGSSARLDFTGLFTGSNPAAGVFAVGASTTIPGVTPAVTPTFAPAANSSNPLAVTFAVPAATPPGAYDVTVSATVAGLTRSGVGHVTVTAPVKSTVTATAGSKAKLSASVKTTTLKAARKTGIPLTLTLSRASSISVIALQAKPKVSATVKKRLKANKKTVVLVKSVRFHKGKVTITFKGGGLTRTLTTTLK